MRRVKKVSRKYIIFHFNLYCSVYCVEPINKPSLFAWGHAAKGAAERASRETLQIRPEVARRGLTTGSSLCIMILDN